MAKKTAPKIAPSKNTKAPKGASKSSTTKPRSKAKTPAPETSSNSDEVVGLVVAELTEASPAISAPRLLPTKSELKDLYCRYTEGSTADEHDKAFYFVLDVGGISRAKQLLAHVEEVLGELEEFGG